MNKYRKNDKMRKRMNENKNQQRKKGHSVKLQGFLLLESKIYCRHE